MTTEQWLVYLWAIYPDGGFKIFWIILLFMTCFILAMFLVGYSDAGKDKTNTLWFKMGKFKILIPSFLVLMIFLSNLIPNRNYFMLIVATPYIVDSSKSLVDSLQDPTSKAYKINQMMNKAIDKALAELDNSVNNNGVTHTDTNKNK